MNIIYTQDNGILAIVALAADINMNRAAEFVPAGKRFKIIPDGFLPEDPTYRDAWSIAETELTDGVGVMK